MSTEAPEALPAAQTAAKWWADQLRYGSRFDNGDHSVTGLMTNTLATAAQSVTNKQLRADQIDRFEQTLSTMISQGLMAESSYGMSIRVDYDPDATLTNATDAAGIPSKMYRFPFKTAMHITSDKVTVRSGYDANEEELPIA